MKKVMVCLLALTFVLGVTAFAQQDSMSQPSDQAAAKGAQEMSGLPGH